MLSNMLAYSKKKRNAVINDGSEMTLFSLQLPVSYTWQATGANVAISCAYY